MCRRRVPRLWSTAWIRASLWSARCRCRCRCPRCRPPRAGPRTRCCNRSRRTRPCARCCGATSRGSSTWRCPVHTRKRWVRQPATPVPARRRGDKSCQERNATCTQAHACLSASGGGGGESLRTSLLPAAGGSSSLSFSSMFSLQRKICTPMSQYGRTSIKSNHQL